MVEAQEVGNPIASILKTNVKGIPALFVLNPISNFLGFRIVPAQDGPGGPIEVPEVIRGVQRRRARSTPAHQHHANRGQLEE